MSNPMRFSGACVKTLPFLVVSALIFSSTQPAQAVQRDARVSVRHVEGTAQCMIKEGGLWRPLQAGAELGAGAVLQTSDNSAVDLFFPWSGTVLRLTPNTELRVEKLLKLSTDIENITDTKLVLTKGSVVGSQRKLPKASTFSIETAKGEAVIRGTEYVVYYDGTVTVLSGVVNINYNNPGQRGSVKVQVSAGFTFNAATRTVVASPTPIPPDYDYHVSTVRNNALVFRVADGATVVVKPPTSTSPVMPGSPPPGGPGPAAD